VLTALLAASLVALSAPVTSGLKAVSPAPPPGFRLVAATARVDYFAMNDSPAKADDARKVEKMLEAIERRIGQRGPGRVAYYRVTHAADMERITGRAFTGLTDQQGKRIVSSIPAHEHELVHAVAVALGDPGRFFHEGLAVALSDDPAWKGKKLQAAARDGLAKRALPGYLSDFDTAPSQHAYAVAGSFVEHLIAAHGLPKVLEFFRGCGPCPRDEMFQRAFGVTMAQAGQEWTAQLLD
jgi:hypothetical protein